LLFIYIYALIRTEKRGGLMALVTGYQDRFGKKRKLSEVPIVEPGARIDHRKLIEAERIVARIEACLSEPLRLLEEESTRTDSVAALERMIQVSTSVANFLPDSSLVDTILLSGIDGAEDRWRNSVLRYLGLTRVFRQRF
jgi:hypothetical protein